MIRYLLTAVGALALVSNVAFAETGTYRHSTTKVMTRSAPAGMIHKKVIIKRHGDRGSYGALVAKKKVVREGMSGSSVSRTRMIAPGAGGTVVKKRTVTRR